MRNPYYSFGKNNVLLSTVYLTDLEAAKHNHITNIVPPETEINEVAIFNGETWGIRNVDMDLTITKTTITANGIDFSRIENLPMYCTVYLDDKKYIVDDGILDITIDTAGIYVVTVSSDNLKTTEFTLEAI